MTLTFDSNIGVSIQAEVACSLAEVLTINPAYIVSENNIKCSTT